MGIIKTEKHTYEDEEGNIRSETKEISYQKESEPDYIKLYTKVWCEFNEIPIAYRPLFLELVQRMTYCNLEDLDGSQLVNTGTPYRESIMKSLGWKSKSMYQTGLKKLVDCKAIKNISRGVYQINPNYAGKGAWKYNPKLRQGGIKDLITQFNFKDKTVNTKIIWADDGENTELNNIYRQGLEVNKNNNTILTSTITKIQNNESKNQNIRNK